MNLEKKNYFVNLPPIKFVEPDVRETNKLSFSIPLFHSGLCEQVVEGYMDTFNETYTKPALWNAMSFLWCSDLGENGVKFYFHIEESIYDLVSEYLLEQDVPEEYIRKVELPEEYQYDPKVAHTPFGKKLLCFYDENMDSQTVNIIDSDCFLCVKNERSFLYRDLTAPFMRNNISTFGFKFVRWNYCYYMQKAVYAAGLTSEYMSQAGWIIDGSNWKESENMLEPHKIEQFCHKTYNLKYGLNENVDASDYVVRPSVDVQWLQIPTNHKFVDFFRGYGHQCYHEEGLLGMYFMSKGIVPIQLSEVLGLPKFMYESEYFPEAENYTAHYVDQEPNPDHRCYADFYRSMLKIHQNIAEAI